MDVQKILKEIKPFVQRWFNGYHPLDTPLTYSAAVVVGSVTLDVSAIGGAPADTSNIKAYAVRLRAKWAVAADGTYAALKPTAASTYKNVFVNSQVNNISVASGGIVNADANGDFAIEVAGTDSINVYVEIVGYFA